ncbi:dimethyl sulfoxide reductase anchor subunit family protein [Aliiruegeria lutimaris]|uniref:DMSO reductase anchor subunit n=1 Tax=Aliiruegeria lutimaris TaxID=571298 RepID=A0A1G8S793_9RHOB|nr:DmsC/YnfH family molybdoenzyme membrane anchor subunit [Aliiruegeria lutimaris]SDJ25031.1 DMSO reductase anchor subunit [Aliiruegeria lutimaris]
MYPAPSVIYFTTLTGLGFGLLAWLGFGYPDVIGKTAFFLYLLGYGFAVGGLFASTYHLANPKNARKAFSQWRTSWLSREAVLSVAALVIVAPHAFAQVFLGGSVPALGWLGAVACIGAVFTTSMIYAQLKTVPSWATPATPLLFLGYAAAGGALFSGQVVMAAILLVFVGIAQLGSWQLGGELFAEAGASLETATGLQGLGSVRQLEPPHSGTNYLLKEMVFQVGRKHAEKLRWIGGGLAFILPVVLLLLLPPHFLTLAIAAGSHVAGVLAIRWLFFAEAKHVVSLYYGK